MDKKKVKSLLSIAWIPLVIGALLFGLVLTHYTLFYGGVPDSTKIVIFIVHDLFILAGGIFIFLWIQLSTIGKAGVFFKDAKKHNDEALVMLDDSKRIQEEAAKIREESRVLHNDLKKIWKNSKHNVEDGWPL